MKSFLAYYKLWYRLSRFSFISLHLIILLSVFYGFFFGNKPFFCIYKNEWHCFVFQHEFRKGTLLAQDLLTQKENDFRKLHYDFSLWPVFPTDPFLLNMNDAWKKPFAHESSSSESLFFFWGSSDLGRDVFSSCFYGIRKGLFLALLSILLSLFFSLISIVPIGFQSALRQRISLWSVLLILFTAGFVIYYFSFFVYFKNLDFTIHIFCWVLIILCMLSSYYLRNFRPHVTYTFDKWALLYIQLMYAIPGLLLVLILIQVFPKPNNTSLAIILAFLYSPILMKYIRNINQTEIGGNLVMTEESLGQPSWKIIFYNLCPRIIIRLMPVMIFGIANIILIEASLSFLGLGMSVEEISLGGLMAQAKTNVEAWWLILFPGLVLFWLIFSLSQFGEWLQQSFSKERL